MKDIYLYGKLGKDFTEHTRLDVHSPVEAVLALTANFEERFTRAIREGVYRITVGPENKQKELGPEQVTFNVEEGGQIHIYPVVEGASGPTGRLIAGTLLLASSFIPQVAAFTVAGRSVLGVLQGFGVALTVGGISELLAPSPAVGLDVREVEENPSFIYNGPLNLQAEGHPVPLVYGRMRVGSYVVNGYSTVAPVSDYVSQNNDNSDDDTLYIPEIPDDMVEPDNMNGN